MELRQFDFLMRTGVITFADYTCKLCITKLKFEQSSLKTLAGQELLRNSYHLNLIYSRVPNNRGEGVRIIRGWKIFGKVINGGLEQKRVWKS